MTIESFASNTPQNTSILQLTKFTFIIPDMPFLKYFCQTVAMPGVSTTEVTVPTPFSNTYHAGDKMSFEALTLTAILDEDMRVWEESYKWLKSLTRPTSYSEYRRKSAFDRTPLYYDGYLTVNTNANNPNLKIKFHYCHPVSIGGITFDTKTDADNIPSFDITFRYDFFEFERV
jgi:hypothetical protein